MKFLIFNFQFSRKKRGFTLVETLIAISIFTVSILALFAVLAQSISNTTYAKQKIVAGYLAQEGIESIRNMRDNYVLYGGSSGWSAFKAKLNQCNSGGGECGFNHSLPYTYSGFIFKCNTGDCKLYINNGGYDNSSIGADSGFVRKIWMVPIGDVNTTNEVKIFSDVSWKQGSGVYNITFSENLFNWTD